MAIDSRRRRPAVLCFVGSLLAALPCFAADTPRTTGPYPTPPAWVENQTLYEVNLRHFSSTGDVEGFRKQLPRLKALGVGTVWIMPVKPDRQSGSRRRAR